MKLIIAGSRTFNDMKLMRVEMSDFIANSNDGYPPDKVISGTARGADKYGEQWALAHNVKVSRCPAQWDRFGKSAGYRRNKLMARLATHAIVFWDGESRGAQHMINIATHEGLGVKIVRF